MSEPGKTSGCGKCRAAGTGDRPKVIVVFGATGQQGGSVVNAIKGDSRFVLKAATRNPHSDKAKKLSSEGIEVIKVDLDDPVGCNEALKDAYGVFLVTNDAEILDANREIQQGKNAVDAAKKNGIQHLIFSGLKGPKERIGIDGCTFIETKIAIYDYIVKQGVPYTVVNYAFYYENLIGIMKPRKNEKGEFVFDIPLGSAPLEMICISDSGEVVHQIFARDDEFKGQCIGIASDKSTVAEYAATLSKTLGSKKFVAGTITTEQYAQLGFPMAADLAAMFEFIAAGKDVHDIDLTRKLHPGIPTFEQWAKNNREAIEAVSQ